MLKGIKSYSLLKRWTELIIREGLILFLRGRKGPQKIVHLFSKTTSLPAGSGRPGKPAFLTQGKETAQMNQEEKKGKIMEKKMIRISGIIFLILVFLSLVVLGCRQAPPPAQQTLPPGGSAQMPALGGSAQMPAQPGSAQMPPASSAQMPAPAGTVQMPAQPGTVPVTQPGIPSRDANQVLVGMTPEQVQQIMGPPDATLPKRIHRMEIY